MKSKEGKLIFDAGSDCGADVTGDPQTVQEINKRVREVMEDAPSDASVQLVLRRAGQGFKGLLRIRSSQSGFAKTAVGNRLTEVVNQIFDDVAEQIRGWKRTRFANAGGNAEPWE